MAPILDFRHVETDNIGKGKRVLKPPGGECSDIFGTSNASFQQGRSPAKNYQQSSIFGADGEPTTNNQPSAARRDSDTQNRLFGATSAEESSPKKVVDRMKSNIFTGEEQQTSMNQSPKKQVRRNPITGEIIDDDENEENGVQNGNNGNGNPITGDGSPVATNPTTCVKIRNPPGGKSSGIF